jgi:hypothetical protein
MAIRGVAFSSLVGLILFHLASAAFGQANSWTNSTSGKWEDSYWSLGILPGTNQMVLLTNEGVKSLTIGSNTTQQFPGTMNVGSITVSSPPGSLNALRMVGSGTVMPLTVKSISVGSNTTMTMYSSALALDGGNGVGLQVGGTFDQTDSAVTGQQVNVGYTGPGVYNLNSGLLDISNLWVGGSFSGVFNQIGGTNDSGIVHLESGGTYNFWGGDFNATVYFSDDSAVFHQTGGEMNQAQTVYRGTYLQSGGTNFGSLTVGSHSSGNYVLSNGYCLPPSLNVGQFGTVHQFGGTLNVTNGLYLAADAIDYSFRGSFTPGGIYWLSGGTLMSGGMTVNYIYTQDGGTNLVAGDIEVANSEPVTSVGLELDGGVLTADNITMYYGGLYQSGGCLKINNLTVSGAGPGTMAFARNPDIDYLGGQLMVSNINVEGDNFEITTTNLLQTGALNLVSGMLMPGGGSYTFGPLMVDFYSVSGAGGQSVILLRMNVDCQIHFADSSALTWGNLLVIRNWSGSMYGGGLHRIFFGTNATALTSNQLNLIEFSGPAGAPPHADDGRPPEIYPARILATGEIVPDTEAPLPPKMSVACSTNSRGMQLSLGADIGQSYDIEVSTDLVNWIWWTNAFNANGTIYLNDLNSANYPQRFYRARPAP